MATAPAATKPGYKAYLAQDPAPTGRLEFWIIDEISFVDRIQRDPTPRDKHGNPSERRMNTLKPFDPDKCGVLRGAILTDGEDEGAKVLTDGLGRKTRAEMDHGNQYILPVWVREMTEVEAAEDFLEYNGKQKKPTPYDHYHVSEVVDDPAWAAVRKGLEKAGVEGAPQESGGHYGDGEKGRVTGIAALRRIAVTALKDARAELDELIRKETDDSDLVDEASDRLAAVFGVTRGAFVNDPLAHDADMLQAVARLYSLNGDAVMESGPVKRHFIEVLKAGGDVKTWRQLGMVTAKSGGGSTSRSVGIARLLGTAFNGRKLPKAAQDLVLPARADGLPELHIPIAARK